MNNLTMTDITNFYVNKFIKLGYAKTKKQAQQMFIECLSRSLVANEIEGMAAAIAEEKEEVDL